MLKWTKRKSNRWKGWFFKSLRNFLWGWRTASLSYNRLSKALSNFVPSGPGSALIENSYLFLVPGKLWKNEEEKKVFFNEDDSLQLQSQNKSNFVFRYGTSLELVYEITTSLTKYRERDTGEPSLLLLLLAMLLVTRLWLYYTYRVYNTVYFSVRQRQQQLYSNSIKGLLSYQDLEYFYRMSSARGICETTCYSRATYQISLIFDTKETGL